MKTKRFLLILLALLTMLPNGVAYADTTVYARVLKAGAILYSDKTLLNPTFEVPYTYYVKIESDFGEVLKVSYNSQDNSAPQIFGYMRSSDLTVCDYLPLNPFLVISVTSSSSDVLFLDYNLQKPLFNLPENENAYFYGKLTVSDKTLCYVYYGSKLGYVDESALKPFSIPSNSDPIITPEPPSSPKQDNEVSPLVGEALQIIIIVGISIITISIVYFLFRPQKNETHKQTDFITDDET